MLRIQDWASGKLAAQCVFPRLTTDKYFSDKEYKSNIEELVRDGIGGFCIFTGSAEDVGKMTSELQMLADLPLLFCADFEHGLPMRLHGGTAFPHAMALGMTGEPEFAYKIGKAIAIESKSIGIHWNLAPVCDVNSNLKNPIINIRSFAEDAETVSLFSSQFILGSQSEKVLSCAKHFPGHGDTSIDSHIALPSLDKTIEEIETLELKPFTKAIESGVKSIMAAHLAVPALDNSKLPASLSEKILTSLLRTEMKFEGLIVTDALDMKAISAHYTSGDSVIRCITAGANIALMPAEPEEAIQSMTMEAENNDIVRHKLENSVRLLIEAKRWCGLLSRIPVIDLEKTIYHPSHEKLALQAAIKSLRTSGRNLLPIDSEQNFVGFAVVQTDDIEPGAKFFNILSQATNNDCDFGFIDSDITDEDIEILQTGIIDAELIIFAYFFRARAYTGSISLDEEFKRKLYKLVGNRPVISLLFGNPYLINELKSDVFISAFSDSLPSLAAAVLELTGKKVELDY